MARKKVKAAVMRPDRWPPERRAAERRRQLKCGFVRVGLGIDKYICHCGDCPQKDLMI